MDEQNTPVNPDPRWVVDSLTKMNFRMGLYADNWDVAVLVPNLTDEQQFTYVGNTPLSGSSFGTNTFYSFMSRPRTTYLQATWHFQVEPQPRSTELNRPATRVMP